MELVYLALGCALGGVIGAALGRMKGRGPAGALFGALMGPLGWIIVLLMPKVENSDPSALPSDYLRKREEMLRRPSGGRKSADDAWNKAVNGE